MMFSFSSRLNITCDNILYGCTEVLKLDALSRHLEECEHNPKRPIPCELGCGLVIPKDEIKVRVLKGLFYQIPSYPVAPDNLANVFL